MPPELEGLRRQLRFRRLVVEETVRFKNKTAGLLMEAGVEYERRHLPGKRSFAEVLYLIDRELRPLGNRGANAHGWPVNAPAGTTSAFGGGRGISVSP
jgi:hypothetical protein